MKLQVTTVLALLLPTLSLPDLSTTCIDAAQIANTSQDSLPLVVESVDIFNNYIDYRDWLCKTFPQLCL